MSEYYVKIEGIIHNAKDVLGVTQVLNQMVEKIHILNVDVTHTETAMILPNGDKMEYSVSDHDD